MTYIGSNHDVIAIQILVELSFYTLEISIGIENVTTESGISMILWGARVTNSQMNMSIALHLCVGSISASLFLRLPSETRKHLFQVVVEAIVRRSMHIHSCCNTFQSIYPRVTYDGVNKRISNIDRQVYKIPRYGSIRASDMSKPMPSKDPLT